MTTALAPIDYNALSPMSDLAQRLAGSALIPDALRRKPDDLLVILLTGREMGLQPMQAIRSIHVIQGKPVLSSDLLVGMVKARHDVCAYFRLVESTAERATYETLRKGEPEPTRMTWTAEDAKRAKLDGKDNWKTHPAAMLRARCAAALARAVYPDLTGGLYETDEGEEIARHAPVLPATEAPTVIDDEPADEVADLRAEILAADSLAALDEIRARLAMRPALRDQLRGDYNARREAITPREQAP